MSLFAAHGRSVTAFTRCQTYKLLAVVQFSFFFFQAEDGIRDVAVTGVQTCALPISPPLGALAAEEVPERAAQVLARELPEEGKPHRRFPLRAPELLAADLLQDGQGQIGRASCRERV